MSDRHPLLESLRDDPGPSAEQASALAERLGRSLEMQLPPPVLPSAAKASAVAATALGKPLLGVLAVVLTTAAVGGAVWKSAAPASASSAPLAVASALVSAAPLPSAPSLEPPPVVVPQVIASAPASVPVHPAGRVNTPLPRASAAPSAVSSASLEPYAADSPSAQPEGADAARRAERALLDQARSALLADDPRAALEQLRSHQQRFAQGTLQEEREALMVSALAADGQESAARTRREAFERRWPRSLYGAAVRSAAPDAAPR